jgi:hypothetical protein
LGFFLIMSEQEAKLCDPPAPPVADTDGQAQQKFNQGASAGDTKKITNF